MSDGTPFLRVAADRIGAPGSPAKMPFRATNAANWSSIIRIGAKMAVIRRQIARRAVSSHTQRAGKVPSGESRLSALNRRSVAGVPCVQADIADLEAIRPAFEGVDVVVHLAAIAEGDATWEEVLPHNIVGTYNVFEAARIAGVKRIISATSGAAVSDSEREMPYRALVEGRYDEVTRWEKLDASVVRPSGLYGCSKLWGEALARHFSDAWGLSMICLRIGMVNQADRPTSTREFSIWCSQRDIGQMVQRCIDAPQSLKFATFYAVSDNKWSYRSLDGARRELGFEPRDQAEQHR